MTELNIPKQCDVLIVGGGPAGSSAAALLSKQGFDVVLLERVEFPRNQVGESLIPHFWKFADNTGVSDAIQAAGFVAKAGGITVWDNQIRQISFAQFGYQRPGLHVERDLFDDLLLQHARNCGAHIYYPVAVKQVDFINPDEISVFYTDKRDNVNSDGQLNCSYLIDASGHSTLLAHQFKSRKTVHSKLNFLSLWGYYKNSRYVGVDARSHGPERIYDIKPVTFVMSYRHGWVWHIILRDKTSVGLVVHTDYIKGMDKQQREIYFKQTCEQLPYLNRLLAPARFIEGSLNYRPDYSYYSTRICGDNFYCIGDAGAFVDPVFSHGVQNAFFNAAAAALAITESFKNKAHRKRYSRLCESRIQQFYGFSRALALGDFGGDGVNKELVKNLIKSVPPLELELILVASEMTNRSENFLRLLKEAGEEQNYNAHCSGRQAQRLATLDL